MPFDTLFAAGSISGSGMAAERLRMEVIANNIANANSTRGPDGDPFRRQDVVFAEVLGREVGGQKALKGVEVVDVVDDPAEFPRVYQPNHPDADAEGYVRLPNVQLPIEMVNLLTASRSYEANLKAAQTFRQMNEQALTLLRS
jgi:flagellar basal-body rod protein FlgC